METKLLKAPQKCALCNKPVLSEKLTRVHQNDNQGILICRECFDNNDYRECYNCRNFYSSDDLTPTESGNHYCENCAGDCVYTCEDCGNRYDDENYYNYGDNRLCESCYDDNYFTCQGCDEVYHNDHYHEGDDNESYCNDCISEHQELRLTGEEERNESTSHFYGDKKGKYLKIDRLIGVEIEAEKGKVIEILESLPKKCGIVKDGSLDRTGIEIRTPPASLNQAEQIITETCQALKEAEYTGTSACGLHIHLDAIDFKHKPLKILHLFKSVYAIEDILFSMLPPSRWSNHYCQRLKSRYAFFEFDGKPSSDTLDYLWYKISDKKEREREKRNHHDRNGTRYNALNIHSVYYRGTIEFRHHAGTIDAKKILKWISLLLSIVDYAINHYHSHEIRRLYKMKLSTNKIKRFFTIFKISKSLQNYILLRIKKFNPKLDFNRDKNNQEADININRPITYANSSVDLV